MQCVSLGGCCEVTFMITRLQLPCTGRGPFDWLFSLSHKDIIEAVEDSFQRFDEVHDTQFPLIPVTMTVNAYGQFLPHYSARWCERIPVRIARFRDMVASEEPHLFIRKNDVSHIRYDATCAMTLADCQALFLILSQGSAVHRLLVVNEQEPDDTRDSAERHAIEVECVGPITLVNTHIATVGCDFDQGEPYWERVMTHPLVRGLFTSTYRKRDHGLVG